MRAFRFFTVLVSMAAMTAFSATPANAGPGNSDQARAEHQRIVAYWTPARAAAAEPRDFILDPATGGGSQGEAQQVGFHP